MEKIIRAKNLNKFYRQPGNNSSRKETKVLEDVSFEIEQGESFCVVGPSGSGKSTLLHLLGGLDTPTSGELEVNGQSLHQLSDRELSEFRNTTIGFVFQFFYLQDYLTALENVLLPAKIRQASYSEMESRARELLDLVGLSHRVNHYPNQMSGGEQQRVAVARALINNPHLILADEPTGNLDAENTAKVMDIFDEIHHRGVSVFIVTHDHSLCNRYSRSLSLEKGKVVIK